MGSHTHVNPDYHTSAEGWAYCFHTTNNDPRQQSNDNPLRTDAINNLACPLGVQKIQTEWLLYIMYDMKIL